MFRIEVQPQDTISVVKSKIEEELTHRKVANLQSLQISNGAGKKLPDTETLQALKITHGELLQLAFVGTVPEAPVPASSSSSTSAKEKTYTPPIRKP
jgi:hypothetical protein